MTFPRDLSANNDVLPPDLRRNHTQPLAKKADVRMEQVTDPRCLVSSRTVRLCAAMASTSPTCSSVRIAMSGQGACYTFAGHRRFPLGVRLPEKLRTGPAAIPRLLICLPARNHEGNGLIASRARLWTHC
jgi:Cu/Ag efflux pump CusA